MKTKEELLYERKNVGQLKKDNQRDSRELLYVIAEVLIDIRDIMSELDLSFDSIKDTLKDIERSRHRNTGVRWKK